MTKFISKTSAPEMTAEELIVYCARVSSGKSDDEKLKAPEKLLKYCIDHEHWSIFEMADMTVEITTSIPISAQILRHRSFSFQQFSARYQQVQGFEPIEIRKEHEKNRQSSADVFNPTLPEYYWSDRDNTAYDLPASKAIKRHIEDAMFLYESLLQQGVAREVARFILPQAVSTTLYMKGSVRSFIHYINLRTKEDTQKEHRFIAEEIKAIFTEQFPIIAKALW